MLDNRVVSIFPSLVIYGGLQENLVFKMLKHIWMKCPRVEQEGRGTVRRKWEPIQRNVNHWSLQMNGKWNSHIYGYNFFL